jgi:hypothetical protein
LAFTYGALTLYGARFHNASVSHRLCDSLEVLPPLRVGPTTPLQHRRQAVPLQRFRLVPFRSPLLGESRLFSFPRGTEMFQFPRFPPTALCVQAAVTGHDPCRVSPFGYPRIEAWSAAPRGLSQPPTSFIGIWRQGIHRWLFVAWEIFLLSLDARARSAVLKGRTRPRAPGTGARSSLGRRPTAMDAGPHCPGTRTRRRRRRGSVLPQNGTVTSGRPEPGGAAPHEGERGRANRSAN